MITIEWTPVEYYNGEYVTIMAQTTERWDADEFLVLRSPWGDAPYAEYLESLGVFGFCPRGAGNDDPYMYVIRPDELQSEYEIALVDVSDLVEQFGH